MAGRKLTVVISQAPGKNPTKRHLEEEIATQLMLSGAADVSLVPNLYDLPPDHHGLMFLRSVASDMVVLGWLFPRALRWTLDRNGIRGHEGVSLLKSADEEEADEPVLPLTKGESEGVPPAQPEGIGSVDVPDRRIYVLDLRDHSAPETYIQEIERIARESTVKVVPLGLSLGGLNGHTPTAASGFVPVNGTTPPADESKIQNPKSKIDLSALIPGGAPDAAPAPEPKRRWYPVIDYSRCTNCMECIDFCLFGVYGVDRFDRILVEQQDNCKKGCPACSRVCPANAIIFPEHKTAAIAGAPTNAAGDFKIDLSKLFGAPSALEVAAQERDTELVADGREAVGMTVGIPKRQPAQCGKPRDALDDLMDGLDSLDM